MEKVNIITRIKTFISEVKSELKKVTWPSRFDLQKTTLAVIVLSVIFGIYLQIVDHTFRFLVERVITLFK